jgi:hypothetical protein
MRGLPGNAATPLRFRSTSVLARIAAASAAKFANDPPLNRMPAPGWPKPTIVFNQSITWCSTVVADGADRHDVTF